MEIRRVTDDFSVSPQIAVEDLAELKAQGFALVINNRPDGEETGQPAAAEIAAAAGAAGIAYRAIPVAGGFSQPQVEEMAEALASAEGPVFAFCRTAPARRCYGRWRRPAAAAIPTKSPPPPPPPAMTSRRCARRSRR